VDGPYIDRTLLEIPRERFLPFDLTKPLELDRTFDLVVSLEVAEHLPWACAETFVRSLTELVRPYCFRRLSRIRVARRM
jgi:2-polyprenyl-3-methyl-5-hydroxy-6-metoxy-1,4-benzoquinol methylase